MGTTARRTALRLVPVFALLATLFAPPSTSRATAPPQQTSVTALFFGDSLMNGTGSRPTRPVMARVAARALGWDVTVDAFGGTGYTTGGKKGRPYLDRLKDPGLLSSRYDVVLLEGGTNDRAADLATMHARTTEAVQYVRQRLPRAQLVLMGAYDPKGRGSDPRRRAIDGVIRTVAQEQGAPFFSPISGGWTRGQGARFLSPDGLHPSTYGYGVMGARLTAALKRIPNLPRA
ncbi:MAG: SGNH/GDSL hydrolase family protein [Actinobacteria bacterium]|nr:SGNH/GDSL hydrolase family protein [Actinomycetota bacterium]MCA1719962.1 SGNH/GDSL hydrolase family protein [Actinomycetota bacterium]